MVYLIDIKIGVSSINVVEIIEGVEFGDKLIILNYDCFKKVFILVLC